jgi:hypothetical protein
VFKDMVAKNKWLADSIIDVPALPAPVHHSEEQG